MQLASMMLLFVVGSATSQTAGSRRPTTPSTTPVPILRQVNSVNDDGSYTFGFEAADGTFKLETRDVDGQVTGKYGYIDANGERQEFEYNANKAVGFNPSSSLIPQPAEGLEQPAAAAPRSAIPAGTLVDGVDLSLVGFSEDKDQDGFVDPLPTGRGTAARRLPAAQPQQRPQPQRFQQQQVQPQRVQQQQIQPQRFQQQIQPQRTQPQQTQQFNSVNSLPQFPASTQFTSNVQPQFTATSQQGRPANQQPQLTFNTQFTVDPQTQINRKPQPQFNLQPQFNRNPVAAAALPRFPTNQQQQFAAPQQNVQFTAGAQLLPRAAGFQQLAPAAAAAAQRFFLPGQNFNNGFQQAPLNG